MLHTDWGGNKRGETGSSESLEILSRCSQSEDSSRLAFLFQESPLNSENQPHQSNVRWSLLRPVTVCFWMWDSSMPQGFWVPDPQPELLALCRDALCRAYKPQTLGGRCKVSWKTIKLRLFIIIIISPQKFFAFSFRAVPLPRSLSRALPFHPAPEWVHEQSSWI